jgi:hypothetical protein
VWWSTPTAAAVSAFALVVTNPIGNAGIGAYRVSQTPAGMQGRVGGALNFAGIVAMPLAPVVGGLLLTRLGGSGAVLALVGLTCVAALVPTLSRSIRSVPRPARWPRLETAGVTGRRAEAGAA